MVDMTASLKPRSPLDRVRTPGTHGAVHTDGPGIVVGEVRDLALVAAMAAKNDREALANAVRDGFGLDLPMANRSAQDDHRVWAFAGLNKWYVMQPKTDGSTLMATLGEKLGDTATLADQTHGQTVLEIRGPAARDVLIKGVPVDLNPKTFAFGDVAAVSINHVHVLLWRTELDAYRIMVMRSFAADLWQFLTTMAAEYGYRVPAA